MDVKPVNGATWSLELAGLIADKRPWTLAQLQTLPQHSMVIKHICVEGWSYIGGWTGVPLRTFLERVEQICARPTLPSKLPTTIRAASIWRRRCIPSEKSGTSIR